MQVLLRLVFLAGLVPALRANRRGRHPDSDRLDHKLSEQLRVACGKEGDDVQAVRKLLQQTNVNAEYESDLPPPLVGAAYAGNVRVYKALIDAGAGDGGVGLTDVGGVTVLMATASSTASTDIARIVLESSQHQPRSELDHDHDIKQNPDRGSHLVDETNEVGATALMAAALNGNIQLALLLYEHKARFNAQTKTGATALHTACRFGKYKMAMMLVELGASTFELDSDGRAPLDFVACKGIDRRAAHWQRVQASGWWPRPLSVLRAQHHQSS